MPEGLFHAARQLQEALRGFDPAGLPGPQCAAVVEELARTEKACAAARALAAARAVEHGAHRGAGFASGAEWLAAHMGSSTADARLALSTATSLGPCPEAREALVAGEVSLAQAHEVARAEAEAPGSGAGLLDLARGAGLGAVRDAARDAALSRADPDELHRRQHHLRYVRHWRDADGMVCLAAAWAPDVGLPLLNRLEAEAGRLRAAARRAGAAEPFAAHAADALAVILSGAGAGTGRLRPPRAELVVVADLAAYRRGHAHAGEVCQIRGGGPLPVERVRQLSEDAFIKAVLHDGVRVQVVKHFGRHIPAELRTALELGPPPGFPGTTCAEAGCGRRYGLEWDHLDPVANHGPTSYDNLVPRCWPHHREKTERDRQAGRLGNRPP